MRLSRLSREIIEGQEVLLRDGVSLHSRKDAVREAETWAETQSNALSRGTLQGPVFVLGCGAAHHLRALSQLRPELHLVAVDFDEEILACAGDFELILGFREAIQSQVKIALIIASQRSTSEHEKRHLFGMGYSVLRFRPAWAGFEAEYTALEASLLDNTPESILTWSGAGKTETEKDTTPLTEDEKLILALKEVVS